MLRSIACRSAGNLDSSAEASRRVLTAAIPQPMSTPTAAGQIAPSVAITLPTVAPMPQCVSGMAATWGNTNGSRPVSSSCLRADSSSSAVQTLTGTRDCRTCRTGMSRSYRAASFRVAAKVPRKARLLSRRQEILDANQERDLRPLDVLLEGQDAVDLRQD